MCRKSSNRNSLRTVHQRRTRCMHLRVSIWFESAAWISMVHAVHVTCPHHGMSRRKPWQSSQMRTSTSLSPASKSASLQNLDAAVMLLSCCCHAVAMCYNDSQSVIREQTLGGDRGFKGHACSSNSSIWICLILFDSICKYPEWLKTVTLAMWSHRPLILSLPAAKSLCGSLS